MFTESDDGGSSAGQGHPGITERMAGHASNSSTPSTVKSDAKASPTKIAATLTGAIDGNASPAANGDANLAAKSDKLEENTR